MSIFKIACSPISNKIYAGKILKNGIWDASKKEVTNGAINAVASHLIRAKEEIIYTHEGEQYILKIDKLKKR